MNNLRQNVQIFDSQAFLVGGGEMGERTRAFDWSQTPLGPVEGWQQSLKTIVRTMLDSRYAMWLGWGQQFTFFYNDAYARMTLGPKHPWALGKSAREVWAEIWPDIGPRAESVLRTGQATWDEGLLLFLERNGFPEETYHTFSYSPVPDDAGGIGGMLCVVTEDTERTIGERRLKTLRELAARTSDEAKSVDEACQTAAHILGSNPQDVPFALLYLLSGDGQSAKLVGQTGLKLDAAANPAEVKLADAPWPLLEVFETGRAVVVDDFPKRFGDLPGGAWPEPTRQAVVLPMAKPGQNRPTGFVVSGVSPRLILGDNYRGFLDLLAGYVATAVANARAYEEERKRADKLAELDRAKTAFFSNVSHEFRTPLTLMLAPVEDLLAKPAEQLLPDDRNLLNVVHRNGQRLQRLVNTLLDFSRIEAGRVKASFEPTNLAPFTAELASNFRSACERAGLTLTVDCPSHDELVFVDRLMWEKIVLNLLSNAFKFTFDGEIAVSMRKEGGAVVLQVRDTGTGIPEAEIPKLFERFYRVENARGRTHEGSGIGLALVQELVMLHGGTITTKSEVGKGTTFSVSLPSGSAHLPGDQIRQTQSGPFATGVSPFVQEAVRWLTTDESSEAVREASRYEGDTEPVPPFVAQFNGNRARVLVADDNGDMRQYLTHLLSGQFTVEAVADGVAALEAVRSQIPDLVLADVMMPRLDGFGLLRELRGDPRTTSVPIVLLSARAGEESRVEGVEAGADDYLVKPFSARELLARVSGHLQMARLRREATESLRASEERFHSFMDHSPTTAYIKDAEGRYLFVNRTLERQFNRPLAEWVGKTDFDVSPPDEARLIRQNDTSVLESMQTAQFVETSTQPDGLHHYLSFKFPLKDRRGRWLLAGMSIDITQQKWAAEVQQQLAAIVESSHDAIISKDLNGTITSWNRGAERLYGYKAEEIVGQPISVLIPPDHTDDFQAILERLRRGERIEHFETVRVTKDGRRVDVSLAISPLLDSEGKIIGASKIAHDITDRKRAEAAVQQSEAQLAAELEATTRLHALSSRLLSADDLTLALDDVLENAILTCRADFGNIQLLSPQSGALEIVAQRGFHKEFLDYFHSVQIDGGSACAQAMQSGERIAIEDVELNPHFESYRQVAAEAGFRSVHSTPLMTHGGAMVGMLSIHFRLPHRVSDRDERLLDLHARHAADFIERLQYEQALKDADQRKDEFLATLAHELRNPLAPIRNGLQIMRLAKDDREAAEQARTMMDRQLGQMVHLVDDLLDVSRISRGKIELRKKRVELAKVIQQAVETSRPLIDASGHELTIDLPSHSIYVDADVTRLAQVFSNLLNNAAKYTERAGRIRLTVQREDQFILVSVKDSGIGIPPSMLPKVFDIFTQVDRNLERSQGGLGIGLSIVKRLVEMHQGTVAAKSDGHGMGSEFVVRLPIVLSVMPPQQHEGQSARPTGRCRILVVDDNRDAAMSLAMMLKLMGNDSKMAHDGLEALEIAATFCPHLILLDIGMPGLDGYETARQIRLQTWGKSVVIVALTGWGQEEDRRKAQEAGFNLHMVKPVEFAAIEKLLTSLAIHTA